MESLTNPFRAKKKPWQLLFFGFLYGTLGLFLGNWIFKEQASLTMVFLTVMGALPLLYNTMKTEEEGLLEIGQKAILKEHGKVIIFFTFLFLGMVFAYSLWYVLLPAEMVQYIFRVQTTTIQSINTQIQGCFTSLETFSFILLNNLKVLVFCILFSFLYGAGAIFILTWNASVISAAIGNFIRTQLGLYSHYLGFAKIGGYLQIVSLGFLRYLLHGIPEIVSYFIGAIAGGIISVAVIKEKIGTRNFEKIILDSANLLLIAIASLVIAAFIEVYITPTLF